MQGGSADSTVRVLRGRVRLRARCCQPIHRTNSWRVIFVALALGSCATPDEDACLVGTLAGQPLTVASARVATASMLPPPPRAEALRLAVDIEVAHRARGKRSDWAGVAAQMRSARAAAGFEPGPCYPAAPASREPP